MKQAYVLTLQKFCKKLIQKFWKVFFSPTLSMKINKLIETASTAKYWFTRKYFILKIPIRKYKLFLYSLGWRTLLLNWFLCQPPPSSFSSLCHWRNKVNWKLVASSTYFRSHTANHCNKNNEQRRRGNVFLSCFWGPYSRHLLSAETTSIPTVPILPSWMIGILNLSSYLPFILLPVSQWESCNGCRWE